MFMATASLQILNEQKQTAILAIKELLANELNDIYVCEPELWRGKVQPCSWIHLNTNAPMNQDKAVCLGQIAGVQAISW